MPASAKPFQEVEYRRAFTEFAKWVVDIDDAARIPEIRDPRLCRRHIRPSRPGGRCAARDMLRDLVEAPAAKRYMPVETHPGPGRSLNSGALLEKAKRPMVVLGGTRWTEEAVADFTAFAERWQLPVGCSFRRQMLFDHLHPNYAGDVGIGINPALGTGDQGEPTCLILLGARLSEMPSSSYTLIDIPYPRQTLVHIHPGFHPSLAASTGRIWRSMQIRPALSRHWPMLKPKAETGWADANRDNASRLSRLVDAAPGWPRRCRHGSDHGMARRTASP
jgi:acetolactate synthase-1/2/3 large subunit